MKKNIPDIIIRLAGLTAMALIYIGLCVFLGNMRGYLNNGNNSNSGGIKSVNKQSATITVTPKDTDSSYLHIIIISLLPFATVWVVRKIRLIQIDKNQKNETLVAKKVLKSQHDHVLAFHNKELSDLTNEIERQRQKYDEANRKILGLREVMIAEFNSVDNSIKQTMRNVYSDLNSDLIILSIAENKLRRSMLYRLKNKILNSKYLSDYENRMEVLPLKTEVAKKNGVAHHPSDYSIMLANK